LPSLKKRGMGFNDILTGKERRGGVNIIRAKKKGGESVSCPGKGKSVFESGTREEKFLENWGVKIVRKRDR